MSKRHTPVPFTGIFTSADLASARLSRNVLVTWLRHHEVTEVAEGVYLPSDITVTDAMRRVFRDRSTTLGHSPVSVAGAAEIHHLWTPPQVPDFHFRTNRKLPPPDDCVARHGRLLVPTAAWTAVQLTRGQSLAGALIPLDSALRLGVQLDELREFARRLEGWSGTASLRLALEHCTALSGSPLESYSRGGMVEHDVPAPVLQQEFRIRGQRYFADFAWEFANTIGEADGGDKYLEDGAIAAEKRRQGALHSIGLQVIRWGWPEVLRNPLAWVNGLKRALGSSHRGAA